MGLYSWMYERIPGGWRTWGPGSGTTPGAFATTDDTVYRPVSKEQALRISAYYACLRIRAETIASLPIQILDSKNNVLKDHPLYGVLRTSPNKDQTGPEFISATIANADMFGMAVAVPKRYRSSNEVYALNFYETDKVQFEYDSDGKITHYIIDNDKYTPKEVFVTKAFGIDGSTGLPQLGVARNVLSGQVAANDAAAIAFRNSLSFGGFIKLPTGGRAFSPDQYDEFDRRMDAYGRPEKRGKYMVLLPGMEIVSGQQFKMTAADAELLASRQFGIEEICRFMAVPPPLIGQTNKASSWASSLDALNQHFVTYGLQPTTTRMEARIQKTLFTEADRAAGLRVKFNMNALLRGDVVKRLSYYKIMQGELGNMTANQVLALEDLPDIGPEGDVRRVLVNTAPANSDTSSNTGNSSNEDEND